MKVISFVNMKGGVGKTTLAVNMADFLSYRYAKKVLLIDVDPQFNATQCLLNGDDYVEYIKAGGTTIKDIFNYRKSASVSVVDGVKEKDAVPYSEIVPYKIKLLEILILFRANLTYLDLRWLLGKEQKIGLKTI